MDGQDWTVFKDTGSAGVDVKVQGNEFGRILHFYKQKWVFVLSIIFSVAGGVLPLGMMIIMGDSFDAVMVPETFLDSFVDYILKVTYLMIAMCVIMGLSFGLRGYTNPTFVRDLRDEIFRNINEQEIAYFDETSSGVLMARMSEDVSFVLNTYVEKLMTAIQYATQVVAGIIIGFITSWRISLVCFAIIPLSIILFYVAEYLVSKE
ncbi:ABC transporter AbcB-related protein [Tritrichomonas foetus]|uniref:ABC transporter AbcB-related protein n=1 Tax=Tritrichomonas foetus TaxID=1144522 RepID=A0A1J4KQZ0_9EUKA|nr:ABC transporter AbcB-related protein [Tritrichomonas foetus]|eukprot:OHT13697.1 ABC transporter AbcB-related protein [Tritrichomonas foetus]